MRTRQVWLTASMLGVVLLGAGRAQLTAGFARVDITPPEPVPMWGYGGRGAATHQGVIGRLWARAVVLEARGTAVALVGTDLGRGPTPTMMAALRARLAPLGIEHVVVAGSHTHHAPVLELTDAPGFGRGRFDAAVRWAEQLPTQLAGAVERAHAARLPVAIGSASRDLTLNRNRHVKRAGVPVPRDPRLVVVRLEHAETQEPVAHLVNWAAHPVMTEERDLRLSPDYPAALVARVEQELGGGCVFLQGAAGDLSPNPTGAFRDPDAYGEELAAEVLALARGITCTVPERPRLKAQHDAFLFAVRVDYRNPVVRAAFTAAFFPELVRNYLEAYDDGIPAEVTTIALGDALTLAAFSGEMFSAHAVRLRERAGLPHLLFVGYANGHSMYLPTIEAAALGGYGADARMAPAALGSGERLCDRALLRLFELRGRLRNEPTERR